MFKNKSWLYLLLLAHFTTVAHNLIPHHHHVSKSLCSSEFLNSNDNHEEDQPLDDCQDTACHVDFLGYIIHSNDEGLFILDSDGCDDDDIFDQFSPTHYYLGFQAFDTNQGSRINNYEPTHIYCSLDTLSFGLRAPPFHA